MFCAIIKFEGGVYMRDWDRNGKIDGRDYYLFHEVILKEDEDNEVKDNSHLNSCRKTGSQHKRKETTWKEVVVIWGIVLILIIFKSIAGF